MILFQDEIQECFEILDLEDSQNEINFTQFEKMLNTKDYKFLDQKTKEDIFFALDKDQNGSLSIQDIEESL